MYKFPRFYRLGLSGVELPALQGRSRFEIHHASESQLCISREKSCPVHPLWDEHKPPAAPKPCGGHVPAAVPGQGSVTDLTLVFYLDLKEILAPFLASALLSLAVALFVLPLIFSAWPA